MSATTLTLEITPAEAHKIEQARAQGVDIDAIVRQLLRHLPEPPAHPMTGAEALAFWQQENVLGSYGDPEMDSPELAHKLREEAQQRR